MDFNISSEGFLVVMAAFAATCFGEELDDVATFPGDTFEEGRGTAPNWPAGADMPINSQSLKTPFSYSASGLAGEAAELL